MTTIVITIFDKPVFCEKYTRRLADKEVRKVVREGLLGLDSNKAEVTIKHE